MWRRRHPRPDRRRRQKEPSSTCSPSVSEARLRSKNPAPHFGNSSLQCANCVQPGHTSSVGVPRQWKMSSNKAIPDWPAPFNFMNGCSPHKVSAAKHPKAQTSAGKGAVSASRPKMTSGLRYGTVPNCVPVWLAWLKSASLNTLARPRAVIRFAPYRPLACAPKVTNIPHTSKRAKSGPTTRR